MNLQLLQVAGQECPQAKIVPQAAEQLKEGDFVSLEHLTGVT
jgi:hypothetical protein